MLEIIKKLDAGTMRGLIVATIPLLVLIASFFGIDEAMFQTKLEGIGEKLVALVSLAGIAWAAYTRLFHPTPPLTETAAKATQERLDTEAAMKIAKVTVAADKAATASAAADKAAIAATPVSKQDGRVRVSLLAFTMMLAVAVAACTGLRQANKAADTVDEHAYVIVEQYASLLEQSANLAALPTTPRAAVNVMKAADEKIIPVIRKVRALRDSYKSVKSADTAAELQEATDQAILLVADLVRAVNSAKGK